MHVSGLASELGGVAYPGWAFFVLCTFISPQIATESLKAATASCLRNLRLHGNVSKYEVWLVRKFTIIHKRPMQGGSMLTEYPEDSNDDFGTSVTTQDGVLQGAAPCRSPSVSRPNPV
jgi:hypothetical protein